MCQCFFDPLYIFSCDLLKRKSSNATTVTLSAIFRGGASFEHDVLITVQRFIQRTYVARRKSNCVVACAAASRNGRAGTDRTLEDQS